MCRRGSIDNEQANTIEEHYQILMEDETLVDPKYTKITPLDLPDWFDEQLFRKGQNYFHKNMLSFIISYATGLFTSLAIPSVAKVFMSTTQGSSPPCLAFKRFFKTEILIIDLHGEDVKDSNSKFYKSVNTIRYMHSMANKRAQRNNADGIMQRDMALVLFCLTGYTLLESKALGLTNTKEEREAYNHFWRVVGHLIGIPDRLNVCRHNERDTTLLCDKILNDYVSKQLENISPRSSDLINAGIEGVSNVDPTLDDGAFLRHIHEMNKIPYQGELSWYSQINYWYKKGIIRSFNLPFIGQMSRMFWNAQVKFVLWLGVNYPLLAWYKFGKQGSKLMLYPFRSI